MARSFTYAGGAYCYGSAPVTAVPLTMACWCRRTADISIGTAAMGLYDAVDSAKSIELRILGTTPWVVGAIARTSGNTNGFANTTVGTTLNAYNHIAGVFATTTSRTVYIDGGNAVTNSTTSGDTSGLDNACVGALYRAASAVNTLDADIAHAAIWNVALTASEIARLYNGGIGLDPRSVRPNALVAYWPLLNNDGDQDYWGNYHLTASGSPTYAQHPPVLMRSRPKYVILGSAAPSIATIEIAGTRQVGNTLTCNATSSPSGATFTYQWYMADDIAGTNQTAISGATAQTYDLSYANIGAATKLYEGLDASGEAFIACGATPTKDAVTGDETVSSYVSITEAAATAPVGSPFESAYIR